MLFICFALQGCEVVQADGGTAIQGGHSGNWYNLGQSGHGVFAEVIDAPSSPTGKKMVVGWYAFFEDQQIWILAAGNVTQDGEGQTAVMTAWIYEGNGFPPNYISSALKENVWGEIRMIFSGCDDAVLEWDSVIDGYGSGVLELQRLTTISGTTCDPDLGGIGPRDDHGNTWQTGTTFPERLEYNDSIYGVHENRDDVDVFIFTLADNQTMAIFTLGSSDTEGTLYRISDNREIEIATDDDSGINDNILIEEGLGQGTYSIHVAATYFGNYGGYTIHIQTNDN